MIFSQNIQENSYKNGMSTEHWLDIRYFVEHYLEYWMKKPTALSRKLEKFWLGTGIYSFG
jgi:hypothetical protein